MNRQLLIFVGVLLCLPLCGWAAVRSVQGIVFSRDCTGHLKRAADANTVELAERELELVVRYLEGRGATDGYTSIIYRTPDEDVGFWYTNLSASLAELRKVTQGTPQFERTNVLMKLRETLVDHGSQNVIVTAPAGISVFPHNVAYFWWAVVGSVLFLVGVCHIAVGCQDR